MDHRSAGRHHQFPQFCGSTAYRRGGRIELAAVFDALKRKPFVAARGRGARLNGRPITLARRRHSIARCWLPPFRKTSGSGKISI
jgi:fructose-1,6-bisphosphatase/inositol monophosphatase family enzyme